MKTRLLVEDNTFRELSSAVSDVQLTREAMSLSPDRSLLGGKNQISGNVGYLQRIRALRASPGLAVFLASVWLGLIWAMAIKPLNAPDESMHLQAVMQVRKFGILPEVHYSFANNPKGEVVRTPVDEATVQYAKLQGITGSYRLGPNQSIQPPLYYIVTGLAALPFAPDPQTVLYVGRLVSVFFGALMVFFIWAGMRELFPREPVWAVAVAGVITLLPQFSFNRAALSNDSVLYAAIAAAFYVWLKGLRRPEYDPWMLRAGGVVGLAMLAKHTGLVLLPGLALVVLFRAFQVESGSELWKRRLVRFVRMSAGVTIALSVVYGWLLVRNIVVYGEPTAYAEASVFNTAQFTTYDFSDPSVWAWFWTWTFQSFWGVFGWMDLWLPLVFLEQARIVSAVLFGLSGVVGSILFARLITRQRSIRRITWQWILIMVVTGTVVLIGFIQFSVTVALQPQGRYLFPLLLPLALLFTGGLYAILRGRLARILAFSVLFVWLAYMNVIGVLMVYLYQVHVP